MPTLTIQLVDADYKYLEKVSKREHKSIEGLIKDLIGKIQEEGDYDVTTDSLYQMEGCDVNVPEDLSINIDKYIYNKGVSE